MKVAREASSSFSHRYCFLRQPNFTQPYACLLIKCRSSQAAVFSSVPIVEKSLLKDSVIRRSVNRERKKPKTQTSDVLNSLINKLNRDEVDEKENVKVEDSYERLATLMPNTGGDDNKFYSNAIADIVTYLNVPLIKGLPIENFRFITILDMLEIPQSDISQEDALLVLQSLGSSHFTTSKNERAKLANKIFTVLKQKIELTTSHYNAFYESQLQNDVNFSPSKFLSELSVADLTPNRMTYGLCMARYCFNRDISSLSSLLKKMKEEQISISQKFYNWLIYGHCAAGHVTEAIGIRKLMSDLGLDSSLQSELFHMRGLIDNGLIDSPSALLDDVILNSRVFLSTDVMDLIVIYCNSSLFKDHRRRKNLPSRLSVEKIDTKDGGASLTVDDEFITFMLKKVKVCKNFFHTLLKFTSELVHLNQPHLAFHSFTHFVSIKWDDGDLDMLDNTDGRNHVIVTKNGRSFGIHIIISMLNAVSERGVTSQDENASPTSSNMLYSNCEIKDMIDKFKTAALNPSLPWESILACLGGHRADLAQQLFPLLSNSNDERRGDEKDEILFDMKHHHPLLKYLFVNKITSLGQTVDHILNIFALGFTRKPSFYHRCAVESLLPYACEEVNIYDILAYFIHRLMSDKRKLYRPTTFNICRHDTFLSAVQRSLFILSHSDINPVNDPSSKHFHASQHVVGERLMYLFQSTRQQQTNSWREDFFLDACRFNLTSDIFSVGVWIDTLTSGFIQCPSSSHKIDLVANLFFKQFAISPSNRVLWRAEKLRNSPHLMYKNKFYSLFRSVVINSLRFDQASSKLSINIGQVEAKSDLFALLDVLIDKKFIFIPLMLKEQILAELESLKCDENDLQTLDLRLSKLVELQHSYSQIWTDFEIDRMDVEFEKKAVNNFRLPFLRKSRVNETFKNERGMMHRRSISASLKSTVSHKLDLIKYQVYGLIQRVGIESAIDHVLYDGTLITYLNENENALQNFAHSLVCMGRSRSMSDVVHFLTTLITKTHSLQIDEQLNNLLSKFEKNDGKMMKSKLCWNKVDAISLLNQMISSAEGDEKRGEECWSAIQRFVECEYILINNESAFIDEKERSSLFYRLTHITNAHVENLIDTLLRKKVFKGAQFADLKSSQSINFLIQENKLSEAVILFKNRQKECSSALTGSTKLMKALVKSDEKSLLREMCETLLSNTNSPSVVSFRLIYSYISCDRFEEGVEVLNTPGLVYISSRVSRICAALYKRGDYNEIEAFVRGALKLPNADKHYLFTVLLKSVGEDSNLVRHFKDMRLKKIRMLMEEEGVNVSHDDLSRLKGVGNCSKLVFV